MPDAVECMEEQMEKRQVTVINKSGLHARPASTFVKTAKLFKSDISLLAGEKTVNAKSVVALLSAGIVCGKSIEICAEGEDEKEAVRTLAEFIESGCGETEN